MPLPTLRSKWTRLLGLLLILGIVWVVVSRRSEEYSPEQLNSLLQNKDDDVTIRKVELTKQGLSPPYIEPGTSRPKDWSVRGHTRIYGLQHISLTSDLQHQVGSIFNKQPIDAESFEMELTFHVHSKATNGLVGDGFGIWFLNQPSDIGDVFGVKNNFNGLGIMLDTYKNGKRGHFPFVNLMLGDGKTAYNKATDGFETRLAGCVAKSLVNPHSGRTKARIVYIKNGYLSIDFNYNGETENWHNCVTLTDVVLPRIKYLGFSAETGDLTEAVDIIENKVFALYKPGTNSGPIELIEELENIIEQEPETPTAGTRNRAFKKKLSERKRKSLKRLKNSEKRIKERERRLRLEKYGDLEATLVRRVWWKVLAAIKVVLYGLLATLVCWVVFTVYRVHQQRKRDGRTTGLLD